VKKGQEKQGKETKDEKESWRDLKNRLCCSKTEGEMENFYLSDPNISRGKNQILLLGCKKETWGSSTEAKGFGTLPGGGGGVNMRGNMRQLVTGPWPESAGPVSTKISRLGRGMVRAGPDRSRGPEAGREKGRVCGVRRKMLQGGTRQLGESH